MNNKDKKQLFIVGFLIIVLLFLFLNTKNKTDKTKKMNSSFKDLNLEKKADVSNNPNIDLYAFFSSKKEIPAINRDPFYKPTKINQESDTLNLIGIAKNGETYYAVINDIIVREGSVIEGATVVEIQKSKVILIKDKELMELQMHGL